MLEINVLPQFSDRELELFNKFETYNLLKAIEIAPHMVQNRWQKAILTSGANSYLAQGYADEVSIKKSGGRYHIFSEGDFTSAVEQGVEPFDMKKGFLSSQRARRAKDGTVYLIIPFRHSVKTLKAEGIYSHVKDLDKFYDSMNATVNIDMSKRYRVVGSRNERNAFGNMVRRNVYSAKPNRYKAGGLAKKKQSHTESIFKGIVKAGSTRHTQYMSFRIVSEKTDQSKWWHPGFRPVNVFNSVSNQIKMEVETMLKKEFERDLIDGMKQFEKIMKGKGNV